MSAQLTDRELLEFAAKAAGLDTKHKWNDQRMCLTPPVFSLVVHRAGELVSTAWNPLINDGDALRLAVEMRMTIDVHLWRDEVQVRAYDKLRGGMYHVDESGETGAATRRAVVRAAAEIGKAMP